MTPRQKRMSFVAVLIAGVAVAIGLALMALNENINHFYGPKQVKAGEAPVDHNFRLGGLVVMGSVKRDENSLKINFDLTDTAETITVQHEGILPDLFREGQGIVATGKMQGGIFIAEQVLAKHDENYMPPEVASTLKDSGMTEHNGKPLK
ncbi:MAG: cytochrome c maturation protein CcmE [Gammaproteobacteria bacterium]|nr:cytochrome c maturation protein CcmE [Gammaproteobacteria bacterium]MDH5735309.1 cytochrome c maturation protein CcmE [Gammaproteobacteria bacterium]